MKFKIELNAKCRNCKHWEFETEDGFNFLDCDETFCKLDGKKRKHSDECKRLVLDSHTLKDNLKSAGFNRCTIVKGLLDE